MRRYKLGAHTKTDLKVHLIWIPKYRKKVLTGDVAVRTRDILRQISLEHELEIITGKVSKDHVHMFISYRPTQNISKIMEVIRGIAEQMGAKANCSAGEMFAATRTVGTRDLMKLLRGC